jgi:hypothetical protein
MNPLAIIALKKKLGQFNQDHPKMIPFFQSLSGKISEGSVLEMKVTDTEGNETKANIRINQNDIDFFNTIKEMGNQQ